MSSSSSDSEDSVQNEEQKVRFYFTKYMCQCDMQCNIHSYLLMCVFYSNFDKGLNSR